MIRARSSRQLCGGVDGAHVAVLAGARRPAFLDDPSGNQIELDYHRKATLTEQ